MIRRHQNIVKEVNGELTTIGAIYMKKYRVVLELGGYKFKTARITDEKALEDQYIVILFFLNPDDPLGDCTLFFCDENGEGDTMYTVIVSPDLVATSFDLGWEDDTNTIQGLHDYYKEVSDRKLI